MPNDSSRSTASSRKRRRLPSARYRRHTQARRLSAPRLKRHEEIIADDTLETQVQNDMSPFPATFREQVSRRGVSLVAATSRTVSLRLMCMHIAASHFSSHVLPVPQQPAHGRVVARQSEYESDTLGFDAEKSVFSRPIVNRQANAVNEWIWEINKDILKHMPPSLADEFFDQICLHSPWALTKDVFSQYFLPSVGTASQLPRVRTRLFFPASLPLFSQDVKCAPLMLATLAGSLALAADAYALTLQIRSLELHGLTRLPSSSITRLLKAPANFQQAWRLHRVSLPGCLAVDDATISTLAQATGPTLQYLDVTLTSITAHSLVVLGEACSSLSTLRLAWCEQLTDESTSHAVSEAIAKCANAYRPRIPFQNLQNLDVSHTPVGDVGVSGLLRLCSGQLTSLDVSYTHVAESGTLDVLEMSLQLGGAKSLSKVLHLGLSGLCVHAVSLVAFLHAWLAYPVSEEHPNTGDAGQLCSLLLDDMVEYSRREPSSLQGRRGLSGDTLHVIAQIIADACKTQKRVFERVHMNGDKRSAYVPSHWSLPEDVLRRYTRCTSHAAVHMLMRSTRRLALGGLDLSSFAFLDYGTCDGELILPTSSTALTELSLPATSLTDDVLQHFLVPLTGALESVNLDHTQVTRTYAHNRC